jgi:hypothetical protein
VRGDDGARYVLKWWQGDSESASRAAGLVERLRQRAYPIPRFVLAQDFDGVTVMLQEYIEGVVSDELPGDLISELLSLNRLQTGVGDARPNEWTDYVIDSLRNGCDGYCVHESLRDHDHRTAELLHTIRRAAEGLSALPSSDIVHLDFHHRNVLLCDGKLRAVIDWEGCRSGDAVFDLVTLAFGLTVANVPDQARESVWAEVCRRSEPKTRQAYAAHMALRQVDWSIRHRTPADVDHWLHAASELLEAAT